MLSLLSVLSEILPIILFLCFVKRNKGEGLWVIFVYCIVSFSAESGSFFLQPADKFYLFASVTICEYTLFTLFLYFAIQERKFKYIIILGSLVFYTMAIINLIYKKSSTFDSLSASVEAILIIVYSILYLYEQIQDPEVMYVYHTKKFWIVVAFFLYFSSTLFLFVYAAALTNQEHKNYWFINDFFNVLKNVFFCISLTMKKNIPISKSSLTL